MEVYLASQNGLDAFNQSPVLLLYKPLCGLFELNSPPVQFESSRS